MQLELRTFQRAQRIELTDFLNSESVKIPHQCWALCMSIGCKTSTEILNFMSRCRSNVLPSCCLSPTQMWTAEVHSTVAWASVLAARVLSPLEIIQTNTGNATAVLGRGDKMVKGEQTFAWLKVVGSGSLKTICFMMCQSLLPCLYLGAKHSPCWILRQQLIFLEQTEKWRRFSQILETPGFCS